MRTYTGGSLTPALQVSAEPYAPMTVVGGARGLWAAQWAHPAAAATGAIQPRKVIAIDPQTGAERSDVEMGPTPIPEEDAGIGLVPGQAVALGGDLFLLVPLYEKAGETFARLLRIPAEP